jgi:hypothetical protein
MFRLGFGCLDKVGWFGRSVVVTPAGIEPASFLE